MKKSYSHKEIKDSFTKTFTDFLLARELLERKKA